MDAPGHPKLYHIVHCDRLSAIAREGCLLSDAAMSEREAPDGTAIGIRQIKERRSRNRLQSRPNLTVGQCVPFYFCPRSVMLYLLHRANHPDLAYRAGQEPIVHLEFDLMDVVRWADAQGLRWAFTLGNTGAAYFEDRCDLSLLNEINWEAVAASDFRDRDVKEGKQAEFLVEHRVDFGLVETIGVHSAPRVGPVRHALVNAGHNPVVVVRKEWYY